MEAWLALQNCEMKMRFFFIAGTHKTFYKVEVWDGVERNFKPV